MTGLIFANALMAFTARDGYSVFFFFFFWAFKMMVLLTLLLGLTALW